MEISVKVNPHNDSSGSAAVPPMALPSLINHLRSLEAEMGNRIYRMSPESEVIIANWPEIIADGRQMSAELIRRHYPQMDAVTKRLADRTLRCLESVRPMAWDGAR